MSPLKPHQAGLTLVELLVSLVLGIVVGGAVLYVFVGTVSTHNDTSTLTQLEEELSAVMNLMVRDIRRAGYSSGGIAYAVAGSTSTVFPNPFADALEVDDVSVKGAAGPLSGDCILYSYDEDADGVLDSPAEEFGWRLNGGAIERRQAGAACGPGGWQDVTWTQYANITGLTFDVLPTTVGVSLRDRDVEVQTNEVNIRLTGQATLRGGGNVSRTLEESVRIRNDQLTQTSP
jgi:type II secretory pathway component PulJ